LYQEEDINIIIGPDMFQKIVSMKFIESAHLYNEKKARFQSHFTYLHPSCYQRALLVCCNRNITKAIGVVLFVLISLDSFLRVKKELR